MSAGNSRAAVTGESAQFCGDLPPGARTGSYSKCQQYPLMLLEGEGKGIIVKYVPSSLLLTKPALGGTS